MLQTMEFQRKTYIIVYIKFAGKIVEMSENILLGCLVMI